MSLAAQFDGFAGPRRPGAVRDVRRLPSAGAHPPHGPETRRAFDLGGEDPGSATDMAQHLGAACLLARRLVEAGVDLVTTSLDGPLCGRVGNWDDHAVNHHVFDAMKVRCGYFDQAVSTLIEDVHVRGLDRRVLIVVTGEFGRTPKINYAKDSGSGVMQPGRDHWPRAVSLIFSGGGIGGGQVVGATDRLGADVTRRRVGSATSSRRSTTIWGSTRAPSPCGTRPAVRSPPSPKAGRSPSCRRRARRPDAPGRTSEPAPRTWRRVRASDRGSVPARRRPTRARI